MKVTVKIHADQAQPEARYTLATLLEVTGLPFGFADTPSDRQPPGSIALHYGAPERLDASGVVIPADDPALWDRAEPACTTLDGVPVLYTSEAPQALFVRQGDGVRLGFDLVRAAFWLLSRQEEWETDKRDAFGRFPYAEHWLARHRLAEVPVVNRYVALLESAVEMVARSQGAPLARKARWPRGQPYAVILSHDVDDAGRFDLGQGIRLLQRALAQRSPRAVARGVYLTVANLSRSITWRSDPYWNFETVMDTEARLGFRSTFFFVPEAQSVSRDPPYEIDTPRMRALLAELTAGGWEVSVHGSFDSHLNTDRLRAQREKLERVSATPVRGVRQHYLRLAVADTFRTQAQAGFAYDSTLGYRGGVGFRAGAAFPFHPYNPATRQAVSLLELPLTVMDGPLFWRLHLNPEEAAARTLAHLDTVRMHEGLAVLLWHQRAWYDKKYPGWKLAYHRAVEHLHTEGLAWVTTAGQVADWWAAREALQLETVAVEGELWRWGYRAGQAVEGLSLKLARAGGGQVIVTGADAAIRETAGDAVWLDLSPLAADQAFEVTLKPRSGAP